MNAENPEEAMTFGELLALIADQQRRLSVLEIAFSSLSLCLDESAALRLVDKLRLEATRPDHDENKQHYFTALADELAKRAG